MSETDHYEVLNVERTATSAEIRTAYRQLVRKVHPDQGGNAALFRLVQEAWMTLSDPQKRAAYDRTLGGPSRPQPDTASDDRPPPREPGPSRVASTNQVQVVPAFGRWRRAALAVLAGWLLLTAAPYVVVSIVYGWDVLITVGLAALILLALPPRWRRRLPFRTLIGGCGLLMAGMLVLLTLPFASTDLSTIERIWIIAVVAGLVVVRVLAGRWSAARELDLAIDRAAAFDFDLWGRPGEPLVDDGESAPLSEYEVLRHRRTARILEGVVVGLPAGKLVHGARLRDTSVDHLVLAGRRMALVSSVVWPSGSYTLDVYGSVLRDGQPFAASDSGLAAAVTAWRGRLRDVEVNAYLIVHLATEGRGRISVEIKGDKVTYLSARSAGDELAAWLRPQDDLLDRRLLYDVLYRAPLDLS